MSDTKICPFCAEEVKREAIKCKHCNSDLSEIVQKEKEKEDETEKRKEEEKENEEKRKIRIAHDKKANKRLAVLLSLIVGLFIYYVSIPILAIWYIWKKTNFEKRKKWISTLVILIIYFTWSSITSYSNREPIVTILEPKNNIEIQAKSIEIKGAVDPKSAILKIANKNIVVTNGNFSHTVQLNNQKNSFRILVDNKGKQSEVNLIINRIFSEEEKIILEQKKEELKKQREIDRAEKKEARIKAEADRKLKEIENTKASLAKEIEIIKIFNGDEYRNSVDKINQEILLFTAWAGSANEAKKNENIEIQQLGKDLEAKLVQLQINEYPKIRLNWGKIMKTTMWEHNITAKISGNKNATITLTGSYFVNNKNIKDTHDTLWEMLKKLRFDRVNYKWSDYSEYTYYTVSSKKDSELFEIKQ